MIIGVVSLLGACLCWSLVFLIPLLLEDFNPIEIALGRFFCYGLISCLCVLFFKPTILKNKPLKLWARSSLYGLSSTLICFSSMVFSIRFADPTCCALIYSLSPLSIALWGNKVSKTFPYKALLWPLIFILIGLSLAHLKAFQFPKERLFEYLLGVVFGFIGLFSWTFYAVSNAHFLKSRPDLSSKEWSLMMGVCVFAMTVILAFVLSPFISLNWTKQFFTCSALLGVIATWLAFLLWNFGSGKVPLALAGQLVVFEVIFGLGLTYSYFAKWPHACEVCGALFMLLGVIISFKALKNKELNHS